jgi:flavodoxin
MEGEQVLVVFHSASGNTGKVAEAIAEALSADIEQIREVNPRPVNIQGKELGDFMNMGRVVLAAIAGRATPIEEAQHDPAGYGLVVVGTPVYAGSVPGPVRAYIKRYRADFKEVAFFCTGEDPNNAGVFERLERICGKAPRAVSAFHAPQVRSGEFLPQVEEFVAGL